MRVQGFYNIYRTFLTLSGGIVDADDPERIILFGSYAYGTPIRIAMEISWSSSPGLMR